MNRLRCAELRDTVPGYCQPSYSHTVYRKEQAIIHFLLSISLFLLKLFYAMKWHPFCNRTLSGKYELLARDFVLQKNFDGSMLELKWKAIEREANVIGLTPDKGLMKTKDIHSRHFFSFI